MPLTPAEKMRRYREKLKENPEKMEEQRIRNLERIKSKYLYKSVNEMSEDEKKKQRKKWREQKKKHKQKKNTESEKKNTASENKNTASESKNPSDTNSVPDTTQKIKRLKRSRDMYRKQWNNAQSRIEYLNRLTENLRKKLYRVKQKHLKTEEDLKKQIMTVTARNEILELSLKNAYKRCQSNKEKDVLKSIAISDIVKEKRASTYIGKTLGLNAKIRKKQKAVRMLKFKQSIVNFFLRDDVSRATAGKRECRTLNKTKEQIRYLNNSLQCLYDKYKREGNSASFASFCRYKPFYILSPSVKNRDTCLCEKHSNINFKFLALKRANVFNYINMTDLLKSVVCDIHCYECMNDKCINCKTKSLNYNSEQYNPTEEISWQIWETIDHTYNKTNTDGNQIVVKTKRNAKTLKKNTIADLVNLFENDLKLFEVHHYNMWHQTNQYNKCIANLSPDEAAIHCDFSQNFECKLNSEVQAMHYGASKTQVTLHTGVLYMYGKKQSFCTVSPSNIHQPSAIWAHLKPVLDLAKTIEPGLKVIHIFSDGPSSQYRQKNNFFLTNHFAFINNIRITWSFFESGHGKGVADAIGGVVKRTLDRQVAYGRDVANAEDVYNTILQCVKSVQCSYITQQDIDEISKLLPPKLKTIPGTRLLHQIVTLHNNQIKHRTLSCFCSLDDCPCFSPKIHTFESLRSPVVDVYNMTSYHHLGEIDNVPSPTSNINEIRETSPVSLDDESNAENMTAESVFNENSLITIEDVPRTPASSNVSTIPTSPGPSTFDNCAVEDT